LLSISLFDVLIYAPCSSGAAFRLIIPVYILVHIHIIIMMYVVDSIIIHIHSVIFTGFCCELSIFRLFLSLSDLMPKIIIMQFLSLAYYLHCIIIMA